MSEDVDRHAMKMAKKKAATVNGCDIFSSDDDDTLIIQPDDVALYGPKCVCEIFSQKSQSDE